MDIDFSTAMPSKLTDLVFASPKGDPGIYDKIMQAYAAWRARRFARAWNQLNATAPGWLKTPAIITSTPPRPLPFTRSGVFASFVVLLTNHQVFIEGRDYNRFDEQVEF